MERFVSELPSKTLRVADLPTRKATHFDISPNDTERSAIAGNLGLLAIRKLKFVGEITASGGKNWQLDAELGATIVQPCVVSLDPVTTRLDEKVSRTYVPTLEVADGSEIEMPDDESVDEIPEEIDLIAVLIESLALALPAFPRSEGAQLGDAVFTDKGIAPMTDEDAKPFAGLGALRDALEKKGDQGE
jgi:uncharacterized metal-binding protein YceD (DUF177 family)